MKNFQSLRKNDWYKVERQTLRFLAGNRVWRHAGILLAAHLSDGLAAVGVDPKRSSLNGFLGVNLGDGPLHLVHESPARCVAATRQ